MKSFFFPPRNFRDELLDLDEAPYEEVRDSLKDVAKVKNRDVDENILFYLLF